MSGDSTEAGSPHPTWEMNEVRLTDFLPSAWQVHEHKADLWVACYRVFLATEEQITNTPLVGDALDLRLVFLFGKLNYLHTGDLRLGAWDPMKPLTLHLNTDGIKHTEQGLYLLVITPYPKDPPADAEVHVKRRIKAAIALVRSTLGRNAAFDLHYENILRSEGGFSAASPGLEQPNYFNAPDISHEGLTRVGAASALVSAHPDAGRLMLALRWLDDGMTRSGIDSFISLWVALETLGMPDSTKIDRLVDSLARTYDMTPRGAKERFLLGRLFGLRGSIIHKGYQPIIRGQILRLMEALFIDVLHDLIGADPVKQAGRFVDRSGDSLLEALAVASSD